MSLTCHCLSLHLLVPIPCSPLAHCCFQCHCRPHWGRAYIHMPAPHLSHHSFAPLSHASHSHSCCVPTRSPLLALIIRPSFVVHPHVHVCPAIHLLVWSLPVGVFVHAYLCLFGLLCLHQIHRTHIIIRKLTFIICIINLDKIIWLVFDM